MRFLVDESTGPAVAERLRENGHEAAKWYEMGMVSQEKAAEIAGFSRADFLLALSRFCVTPFQSTADEIMEDLGNAD
jgi:predicted nuclease of predicted toxin-antitoxin system